MTNIRLDTFICLDLETTGLDDNFDRIIEVGAVHYDKGQKKAQFEALVNPGIPLPPDIVDLTGIDDELVSHAEPVEAVISRLALFLSEKPLIVGHNVRFDIGFLKRHLPEEFCQHLDLFAIDTAVLGRLVWPGLRGYSLAQLADHVGLDICPTHRALRDAEVTAEVYIRELAALANLPRSVQLIAAGLLFGLKFRGPIISSLEAVAKTVAVSVPFNYDFGDNLQGSVEIEPVAEVQQISPQKVGQLFDKQLPALLDGYEERPQQRRMAEAVIGAFNRSEILLAEAPTGVGKSLAYLLPAALWAITNGESVIISTATKNLQDQLFTKDIPLVRKVLGFDFQAVLLKGRGNYLCLLKYYELVHEAAASFGPEERHALLALVVWAETTRTGDIAECTGFSPARWRYLWARASCEGSFCMGRNCRYYSRCFLFRAKTAALSAHLCVVNHHLLFADFAAGGDLLSQSGHAILDEAHNVEKIAASFLGLSIGYSQFLTYFNQVFTTRPVETGLLSQLKLRALGLPKEQGRFLNSHISRVQRDLLAVRGQANDFFDALVSSFAGGNDRAEERREVRYDDLSRFVASSVIESFSAGLEQLQQALEDLVEAINDLANLEEKAELALKASALAQDLNELRRAYEFLVAADDPDFVYWIEAARKSEIMLVSAPVQVGKLLDRGFYDRLKTLVFCSATLSVAGDFGYFQKRLGLDLSSAARTSHLALDCPFDLERNVGFFGVSFLPSPNAGDFDAKVAEVIEQVFVAVDIKGMVLFTSYKSIATAIDTIGQRLLQKGYELFVQDGSQSPARLLARYRSSAKGIIFGTDSFWEGVDLPGEDLKLLVIVRLPFTVPDRPWHKANLERIERAGRNPFFELSLPEAVIKFRQGFGRLIRKKTDTGCVVVLDPRLSNMEYGRFFLNSVPPRHVCLPTLDALIAAIKERLGPHA